MMQTPVDQVADQPAISGKFDVMFLRAVGDEDNYGFIGCCAMTIKDGKLTIKGRRYPSERHRQQITHGYRITDVLVASIIGIALYPLACTYVYLGNYLLTIEDTLVIDLAQVCNVSCDWDYTYFDVRGAEGEIAIEFIANTGSLANSEKLVARLTATRVQPGPEVAR